MVGFVLSVLLWLQLQFGALRVLERLPGPAGDVAVAVVWAASAVLAWVVVNRRDAVAARLPWRALATPWPAAVLVALVALVALFVYPAVDDRRSTGGGSDADDAVVLVVEQLRDGEDPFAEDTYLGNPPTTGPGSILWAAPWPGRRAYAFSVTVALGATLVALARRYRGWEVPSVAAGLLAVSVPFWEGVAQGSDHLAMALGLAVVVCVTERPVRRGVLAGVLATWRAAYLHLPVLLALSRWKGSRREALTIGAVGLLLALALHGALLSWTDGWDAYDPVQQLFVKSDEDLGTGGRALVVVAALVGGAVILGELRRRQPDPAVLVLAGIGAPLAGIAIAGALTADDPAAWSEASYLLPTLALAAVRAAHHLVGSPPT